MRPDTLGVIGLGAVGGSVAWQATAAGIPRVLGFTRRPVEGVAAVRAGAVTELATSARSVLRCADLVVLAAPPAATLRLLDTAARDLPSGAFCTDVTGVQAAVLNRARAVGLGDRFAASHPLVEVPGTGFAAAAPDRFTNAVVYVSPDGDDDATAREVADFWERVLGAHPVVVDADTHDALIAWTEHLPQTVGAALAHALAVQGPRGLTYPAATRRAVGPTVGTTEVWRDLLLLNRARVLDALEGLETSIGALRRALREGDAGALEAWLEAGARWRREASR